MVSTTTKSRWSVAVPRTLFFLLVWWVLTGGAASSWWVGVPAVMLALAVSLALLPPVAFSWSALLGFIPFFLLRSLLGGVDVARRVLHPAMPIAPDIVEYPLRLPPGLPRVMMAGTVNLLPGTLGAAFDQNVLKVHVLDARTGFMAELEAIEQRVAAMFKLSLQAFQGVR